MENSLDLQPILFAAGGAFAIWLLDIVELRNVAKDRRPDFRDIFYWVPVFINPLLAAFVAYVYIAADVDLNPILAVNVGASAPLLLRSFANVVPKNIQK